MTVLSVAVLCTTGVMTSHALAHVKKSSALSHTFPKLGTGAMVSRFREQLTHRTDPAVFSLPD